MSDHDKVINTFLDSGLRQRRLDDLLASNCVLDWFGRTFVGQQRVVGFFHSNTKYEHEVASVEAAEKIEDRHHHFLT